MNHKLMCLIIVILTVSCGVRTRKPIKKKIVDTVGSETSANIDELIKPYTYSFELRYNQKIDISVTFDEAHQIGTGSSAPQSVGICRVYSNGVRDILIDRSWWECKQRNASGNCQIPRPDIEKRVLIYHELGHCIMNRDHDFEYNDDGSKKCLSYDTSGACLQYAFRMHPQFPTRPLSIMYPIMDAIIASYSANREFYDYELNHVYPLLNDTNGILNWDQIFASFLGNASQSINEELDNHNQELSSDFTHSNNCVKFINEPKN